MLPENDCGSGLIKDYWHRPTEIDRVKYSASFLQNLPNYYFLGFHIKDLLKTSYSSGNCHACAIALSLCFYDFEIITCNLSNFAEHITIKSENSLSGSRKLDDFEHMLMVL